MGTCQSLQPPFSQTHVLFLLNPFPAANRSFESLSKLTCGTFKLANTFLYTRNYVSSPISLSHFSKKPNVYFPRCIIMEVRSVQGHTIEMLWNQCKRKSKTERKSSEICQCRESEQMSLCPWRLPEFYLHDLSTRRHQAASPRIQIPETGVNCKFF